MDRSIEFTRGEKIDRRDLSEPHGAAFPIFKKLRQAFVKKWLDRQAWSFWSKNPLLEYAETHQLISDAITSGKGFSVGRLGGVEGSILLWAQSERNPILRFLYPFSETSQGATNAGIRPRNPAVYRFFSKLLREAMTNLDLQGVWRTGCEAVCIEAKANSAFFDVEITGPDGKYQNHWLCALKGKRVLVVSPFVATVERQVALLNKVWPQMRWMEETDFVIEPFPYLIDEECPETWWEVYDRIGKVVLRGEYDVALFGCGGLGLPFAHLAKKAGRIGMHLGGHLQLIFGIYGQRHLHHHWFRDQMNEFWVRPEAGEVPNSAKRVEGGCYW